MFDMWDIYESDAINKENPHHEKGFLKLIIFIFLYKKIFYNVSPVRIDCPTTINTRKI